jgi:hypothetical protein
MMKKWRTSGFCKTNQLRKADKHKQLKSIQLHPKAKPVEKNIKKTIVFTKRIPHKTCCR